MQFGKPRHDAFWSFPMYWWEWLLAPIVALFVGQKLCVFLRPIAGFNCPQCHHRRLGKMSSLHLFGQGWFDFWSCPKCKSTFRQPWGGTKLEKHLP
jgi:hypothetical protein